MREINKKKTKKKTKKKKRKTEEEEEEDKEVEAPLKGRPTKTLFASTLSIAEIPYTK